MRYRFRTFLAQLVVLLGLVLLTLAVITYADSAAAATLSAPTTNAANFFDHVPAPYIASVLISGNAIPYLGHLLTRWPATRSGYLAGLINVGFALVSAVLAAVAASDDTHWLHIAAVTVVTFLVVRLHLAALIKHTPVESWLARNGVASGDVPAQAPPPA